MTVSAIRDETAVVQAARTLAREEFAAKPRPQFGSHPAWERLRSLGTELWLDTGDEEAAAKIWTREFSNLTTNNTLVNTEVQKGSLDEAVRAAGRGLRDAGVSSSEELITEVGFVVNCRVALRLVEAFDATVSVELHPGMSQDVERSVEYGRRYYAVCPERFIIKVPLTPAGFLAARQLSEHGIPVNYTLGFSARQNVVAAAFSRPAYVNVFMGRLNSFVKDNGLGDGEYVGEKATMATQVRVREGRAHRGWVSKLIGASMRTAQQAIDLAGLDVFTLPTKVATEFIERYDQEAFPIESHVGREFTVEAEPESVLRPLWDVPDPVYRMVDALGTETVEQWTGRDLAAFGREHGVPDLFHEWSRPELEQIRTDGKVPKWERWESQLRSGEIALDDLMTVSALQSFVKDQDALDNRIRSVLQDDGIAG